MRVLLLVDYQKDFVSGSLGFKEAEEIDEDILELVKQFDNDEDLIIATQDTHHWDYLDTLEGEKLPIKHTIEGTDGWIIYGKTGEYFDEHDDNVVFVMKDTFPGLKVVDELRYYKDDITEIHLAGVVTNMCVISNAIIARAALPNVPIYIHKDLCKSFDKEMHDAAIKVMESMYFEII